MKVHLISVDGKVTEYDWRDKAAISGQFLRETIHGFAEYVAVLYNGKPATLIVNETGAIDCDQVKFAPNARATAIYWTATIQGRTPATFNPLQDPMVHGPAILVEIDKRLL